MKGVYMIVAITNLTVASEIGVNVVRTTLAATKLRPQMIATNMAAVVPRILVFDKPLIL